MAEVEWQDGPLWGEKHLDRAAEQHCSTALLAIAQLEGEESEDEPG